MNAALDDGPAASLDSEKPAVEGGNRGRFVAYLILLICSIGFLVLALALPASRWEPLGAGTFPAIVLTVLIILCALGLIQEVRGGIASGPALGAALNSHRLVVFTFISFVLCVLALPFFGFGASTFVFLTVVQLALAPKTWKARVTALIIAVVFSFGLVWFFGELFNIFLPRASLF